MITAPLADALGELNDWASETQGALRSTVPRHSGKLAKSIVAKVKKDRKGEPYAIAFNFERYGAWLEKGASRGHGGNVGSRWNDKNGKPKRTNPNSLGKMNSPSRPEKPWFDPIIDQRFPFLADLVVTHYERILVQHIHMK